MASERVWQIACGEAGRRYENLFVEHDVILMGPGQFKRYDPVEYERVLETKATTRGDVWKVRLLAEEVQAGDYVLLRAGYHVLAIGIVAGGGYSYEERFDDVYGWDLSHTRRVLWQDHLSEPLKDIQKGGDLFASRKQIPTFTRVQDESILAPIRSILSQCRERDLRSLPEKPPKGLSVEELGVKLFEHGLSYEAVQRVRLTLEKQRHLVQWYYSGQSAGRPSEHEVVAHVILPLMTSLGWSEQLLAIEWKRIDLAVFGGVPTDKKRCRLVCEAKAMGHGLQNVFDQARAYVESMPLPECDRILVAEGGRFYLYKRSNGSWGNDKGEPNGYINVLKIRERHLLLPEADAVKTLMALTPLYMTTRATASKERVGSMIP